MNYFLMAFTILFWLMLNGTIYCNKDHFKNAFEMVNTMSSFYMAQIFAVFFYFIIQALMFIMWYFAQMFVLSLADIEPDQET